MLKKEEMSDPNSCLNRADDDMPIFVLKAPDICATTALNAWIEQAARLQASPDKIKGAVAALENFLKWQADNPERVKIPD